MRKDLISGGVWTAIFAVILIMARALPESVAPYPTLVASTGLVLCIIQVILMTVKVQKHKALVAAGMAQGEEKKPAKPEEARREIIAGVALLAYGLLFKVLGYLVATPLFLLAFMHILAPVDKERSKKAFLTEVIISVCMTAVIYVLFDMLLKVNFPKGILPF